jgi:hypothetical protein
LPRAIENSRPRQVNAAERQGSNTGQANAASGSLGGRVCLLQFLGPPIQFIGHPAQLA